MYNVVLFSGVEQSNSYIYDRLFSITGYYNLLNYVPTAK